MHVLNKSMMAVEWEGWATYLLKAIATLDTALVCVKSKPMLLR